MLTTTLEHILSTGQYGAMSYEEVRKVRWLGKLMDFLGKKFIDNEPIPFAKIVESNSLLDALWCLDATPSCAKQSRLFTIWCARYCQGLVTTPSCLEAINVSEKFEKGEASEEELKTACDNASFEVNSRPRVDYADYLAAYSARRFVRAEEAYALSQSCHIDIGQFRKDARTKFLEMVS